MRSGRCRVGWRAAAISPPAAGSRSTKERTAIRRAFSVIGLRSAQRCAATADAYVRTLADARQVGLLHCAQVAVLHAHGDAIGGAFLDPVLDRVARDRAADRAGRGGDVLVALAAAGLVGNLRSEERRVGKECVSKG